MKTLIDFEKCGGKTIDGVKIWDEKAAIAFTDGTYTIIVADNYEDFTTIENLRDFDPFRWETLSVDIGIITEEEAKIKADAETAVWLAARAKEQAINEAEERQTLRLLKAKYEKETP